VAGRDRFNFSDGQSCNFARDVESFRGNMSFTIEHFRDGTPVGIPDHATTMYAARSKARNRHQHLHSTAAVIIGKRANGDNAEVEVINFTSWPFNGFDSIRVGGT
jgi:hypothetical protein